MLSYEKWKKLNENFGFAIGVGKLNKIGELQSRWDEMGMLPMKKKGKMLGGDDGPDMGPEGSKIGGDEAPPFAKKGKKSFGKPEDDADDLGDEEDSGDEDMGDEDMGDEEDHDHVGDEGDEDMGDMGDMGGGDEAEGLPTPPLKKGKGILDKTRAVADGAKMMHKGASKMVKGMKGEAAVEDHVDDDEEMPVKKGCASKKCSMPKKKMTKEQYEFLQSLQSQTGACKFEKNEYGNWVPVQEDAIIPPSDPNEAIQDDEPAAGEVGFAPQGRVGSNFSEWASKHQSKAKKLGRSWFS